MPRLSVVVSSHADWAPYHASRDVSDVDTYLAAQRVTDRRRLVLNLCNSYRYLSHGYYCSLLAESRGQRVLPSIRTINNLRSRQLYVLDLDAEDSTLERLLEGRALDASGRFAIRVYFGQTPDAAFADIARDLFERFPCPILEIRFRRHAGRWRVDGIRAVGLDALDEAEENHFAEAIDRFSRRIWRTPRAQRRYSYDLAVLTRPDDPLPPSNAGALARFEKAARAVGIDVGRIVRRDYARLAEYDALFIRETTSIADHTYRFARRAESQGSVVIDDPGSILRCTNKVYLANLLLVNDVPTPRSVVLDRHRREGIVASAAVLDFPLVLKIPDGSFSRGVVKARDAEELERLAGGFFERSALILAQEFYPTDYDWRIGVLNGEILFACRYYMSRGHWQIYHHGRDGKVSSGGFDTLAPEAVPAPVTQTALRAARLIGDGLYGVDLKQRGDEVVVIEVNDNPNIDAGIEDRHLGEALYARLAEEFRRRLDLRTRR